MKKITELLKTVLTLEKTNAKQTKRISKNMFLTIAIALSLLIASCGSDPAPEPEPKPGPDPDPKPVVVDTLRITGNATTYYGIESFIREVNDGLTKEAAKTHYIKYAKITGNFGISENTSLAILSTLKNLGNSNKLGNRYSHDGCMYPLEEFLLTISKISILVDYNICKGDDGIMFYIDSKYSYLFNENQLENVGLKDNTTATLTLSAADDLTAKIDEAIELAKTGETAVTLQMTDSRTITARELWEFKRAKAGGIALDCKIGAKLSVLVDEHPTSAATINILYTMEKFSPDLIIGDNENAIGKINGLGANDSTLFMLKTLITQNKQGGWVKTFDEKKNLIDPIFGSFSPHNSINGYTVDGSENNKIDVSSVDLGMDQGMSGSYWMLLRSYEQAQSDHTARLYPAFSGKDIVWNFPSGSKYVHEYIYPGQGDLKGFSLYYEDLFIKSGSGELDNMPLPFRAFSRGALGQGSWIIKNMTIALVLEENSKTTIYNDANGVLSKLMENSAKFLTGLGFRLENTTAFPWLMTYGMPGTPFSLVTPPTAER